MTHQPEQRESSASRQAKNAAPLIALGLILWIAGGFLYTQGDGGPGGIIFGVLGIGLLITGVVLKLRA